MPSIAIQSSFDLQPHNSLGVPSQADYFVEATGAAEICEALTWANDQRQPVYILGEGTNVILPEKIHGVVLRPLITGIQFHKDRFLVTAGAGENWHKLVTTCCEQNKYGLENLALIPGSVGAAPMQNIGAYGVELKDIFHSLEAIDREKRTIKIFTKEECQFSYRDSVFKSGAKNRYIITKVTLKLSAKPMVNFSYPSLAEALNQQGLNSVKPKHIFDTVVKIRRQKLPDPKILPNVGSFFKNPIVDHHTYSKLKKQFPQMVAYKQPQSNFKLAAGWLIENMGWRGKEKYQIKIHDQQALVLTNPNKIGGDQVLRLAVDIQNRVLNMYGIELEIEPEVIN